VAKRLHGLGVHLVPYSYVRYLGATSTDTTAATHSKGYTTTNTSTNNSTNTSTNTTSTNTTNTTCTPQAVLFLAKTYDSLNTQSITADKVTFAPASIPTTQDRVLLNTHTSYSNSHSGSPSNSNKTQSTSTHCASKPTLNESHPHGFLLRSGLELDRITGGVVANMSLQVCEGVFVAGAVASVYCGSSGGVDLSDGSSGNGGSIGGGSVGQ